MGIRMQMGESIPREPAILIADPSCASDTADLDAAYQLPWFVGLVRRCTVGWRQRGDMA
jgi:hypothetical protein